MTKTLADMTAEERQACVGMWAEWAHGDGQMVLVVIEEIHPVRDFAGCMVPGVRYVEIPRHQLSALTPRNDLPRAWNPDGTPPEWDWQYADYIPGINRGFYTLDETVEKGPELSYDTFRARRLVGDWEEDK